jgi:hypothetical protein
MCHLSCPSLLLTKILQEFFLQNPVDMFYGVLLFSKLSTHGSMSVPVPENSKDAFQKRRAPSNDCSCL